VTEAATTTATRDARLPAISPTELRYLDLSVSLLHSIHPVAEHGEDRAQAVTVGRHGLQISQGGARGLLLPSVATENDLDAVHFLQQVCMKAGLPPVAWKDDDSRLATFESLSFGGPFHTAALEQSPRELLPKFPSEQLGRLAIVFRDNVVALMRGATPTYYAANCSDGTVQCVTVWLGLPQSQDVRRFSQLSIRPGLPLQATMMELAKAAASSLSADGFTAEGLANLTVDLSVLYDPAMHGTIAAPDLAGLQPHRRAVLVMENDKSAITFDPDRSEEELLASAALEAQVQTPESASIIGLETASTKVPFTIANVPKPQGGATQRPPAVAGTFYPQDAGELDRLVDDLLPGVSPPKKSWAAAMVPHAGLTYSGRVAAAVFQQVDFPETVIVLGPKHTRFGVDWAVAPYETWSLPGRTVASDPAFARVLADSIPNLQLDVAAHAREHAIEVELPFLARLAPRSRVIGIAIGTGDLRRCRQFADALAEVLRKRNERTLLVISTDMNHFASDAETRLLDEMALTALERLDAEALYEVVRREHISMCGVLPAVIVLETLSRLERLEECVRVGYATTADVTGDRSRVVGYAGMLFA
jgi:AmmeMemoRadiSam system protein B